MEDEPSNIRLLSIILNQHPEYRLLVAETGKLGIKLAIDYESDLVLLDINLKGENGFDIYEELQSNEQTKTIPVIAVSANAMPNYIEKVEQMGFHGYITKPIEVEHFFRTIDSILGNPSSKAEYQ